MAKRNEEAKKRHEVELKKKLQNSSLSESKVKIDPNTKNISRNKRNSILNIGTLSPKKCKNCNFMI